MAIVLVEQDAAIEHVYSQTLVEKDAAIFVFLRWMHEQIVHSLSEITNPDNHGLSEGAVYVAQGRGENQQVLAISKIHTWRI